MPDVFGASGQFSIDALNNQAQNNINNLYTGGGFGAQTNYYSALGANYLAQVPTSEENPYAGGGVPASLAYPGASLSGGYTTGVANMPHFDAGPNFGFTSGGAGGYAPSVNNPAINWSQLSGGLGSGGALPSIDWSNFTSPSNSYSSFQGAGGSGGMFGGLTGSSGGYQGPNNAIDWSNLFGGGNQSLPNVPQQQAPAIDWNSFQSPSNNYNTFQGAGIQAPDPTPQAQAQPPYDFSPAPKMPDAQKLLGYDPGKGFSAGAAQQPAAPDQGLDPNYWANTLGTGSEPAGTHVYDLAPMFESGGGGKFGAGGAENTGTSDVKSGSLGGDAFTFNPGAYRFDPVADKGPESTGPSADDMAAEARARLAGLMGGQDARTLELKADPKDAAPPEAPVAPPAEGEAIPLPVARPAGAPGTDPATDLYPGTPPPRPPASIPFTVEPGKEAGLRGVQPRLAAAVQGGAQFLPPGYSVEAYSGARNTPGQAYHMGGRAMDVRIIGPDGPIPSEGADNTGMYTLLARGVKTWAQQNDPGLLQTGIGGLGWGGAFGTQRGPSGGANSVPDLMHFDLGGSRGALQPDRWPSNLRPLTAEEKNAMPANIPLLGDNQVPLDAPGAGPAAAVPLPAERPAEAPTEQRPGVNQGQDITPPPAAIPDPRVSSGGFNALDAAANVPPAPAPHTGLELARANIDTPIEKIAMERGGQKAVDQISFMAMGKTPRELAQSYGSMFFSNAEPLFKSLGITRQDFDKAAASPQTKQDIKMRFADMPGGFGEGPDYTGPEAAPGGGFADFRQSPNVEDRRGDLAALMAGPQNTGLGVAGSQNTGLDPSWADNVAIPDTPLGRALGLPDIGGEATSMRDFQSPANDYSAFQQPASRADLAKTMTFGGGFSPSPEPRQGGVGPQAALEPDFMDVIKEVESSGNPDKVTNSYKGLYQLDDKEFRKYGGTGSIFDPEENTKAASAKMVDETQRVQDILGRALTPPEQYMVHQQGVAGSLAHLANPDELAWKNFQGAASSSAARAKEAIWGNMTPEMQKQFGNDVNNVTSRDFLRLWEDRYYGVLNR